MILNDRELIHYKGLMVDLIDALNSITHDGTLLQSIQINSIESQIKELEEDIYCYKQLKEGNFEVKHEVKVKDLPIFVISARIAKNISQEELAYRLGVTEKQVQMMESNQYQGTSLSRALKVVEVLDVGIERLVKDNGDSILVEEKASDFDWASFPIVEMRKRGWISDIGNAVDAVKSFIQDSFGQSYEVTLYRKANFAGKAAHAASLLAWQARVISKAEETIKQLQLPSFELNDSWIPDLVGLSQYEDGPIRAKEYLLGKGIILVNEPHLEKTYLDGAAMLSEGGNPVIGMTFRHDRLDNFWFVLMHELGHVFLHLHIFGNEFVDEDVGNQEVSDVKEKQADQFALDSLISPQQWRTSVSRIMKTEKAILGDAQRFGVGPAIVAGRLRKEFNNYTLFSQLVGYGKVKELFE
ncbi:XRE family transcriptional regulator [Pseudoalteromonas sp. A757]|uniref:XRE family transcriptional regulator n=1 Tax=Pseudoalteromonas sp. A757 TaxID=2250709 RepID=UPI000FFEF855|nr:XRE family transcriptional regulator [Pseudoalteromonas sp. A757]RXE84305.1 DNA-binding protein [Pseudoalteromonas sp. A757]